VKDPILDAHVEIGGQTTSNLFAQFGKIIIMELNPPKRGSRLELKAPVVWRPNLRRTLPTIISN
jgi:hypothetical protein